MRAFKIGILTATALTISTISYFSQSDDELMVANDCQCSSGHLTINNSVQCMKVEQESTWMSWLTGDSRSAQFHYLDLLELLTSSDEPQKARSLSPRF
ncbi:MULTISPECIES: hypothetical protein [Pseudoalteromonas]|jgi:hypothetical protein|uniref:DUF3019 domain-containing protein n=1 Tax=Pseudoalteromonas prydzensis TaxID=182141 RepID=A0ABR9FIY1_9GAMM|nr:MULTISPECIES: hypothetical protein [Pseudoalteromonas]MBE0377595.1 hypothetical protein [Pseudoalteromonas prydzensis ACAM 620]MBE0456756.1 hypothetical protein [Pseudoalteromonas prydzensis]WKD22794.1 hypothetical protein NDQ71_14275 [Pseudoalteromonas sp. KG3]